MDALYTRYASPEMQAIFSEINRARLFRKAWVALAEAQHELGVPAVTKERLELLRNTQYFINLERINEIEKETRHDVMAHIKHWAELVPEAAPIIHLGATSCYATDNADLMMQQQGVRLLFKKYVALIEALSDLAMKHADTAVLGYTHFQPAQPTTMGKRMCMWIQDMMGDLYKLENFRSRMKTRGAKGTTGTQASFLELFQNDEEKVKQLDQLVAEKMGFETSVTLGGQTYPRKIEATIADVIAGFAMTFNKMGTDVRLLCHTGDVQEEFGSKQVGSSAMPYKRNPITAERLCSLSRLLPHYRNMLVEIAENQWLERSLDDSAARRIAIPHMFLIADAVLDTGTKLVKGLVINIKQIATNNSAALPFMMVEQIIVKGVEKGGDRQELHELLRKYAMESMHAKTPSELFLIKTISDPKLAHLVAAVDMDISKMVGMAPSQTRNYIDGTVRPYLSHHPTK
jgi:adenylosuccinate lyase